MIRKELRYSEKYCYVVVQDVSFMIVIGSLTSPPPLSPPEKTHRIWNNCMTSIFGPGGGSSPLSRPLSCAPVPNVIFQPVLQFSPIKNCMADITIISAWRKRCHLLLSHPTPAQGAHRGRSTKSNFVRLLSPHSYAQWNSNGLLQWDVNGVQICRHSSHPWWPWPTLGRFHTFDQHSRNQ